MYASVSEWVSGGTVKRIITGLQEKHHQNEQKKFSSTFHCACSFIVDYFSLFEYVYGIDREWKSRMMHLLSYFTLPTVTYGRGNVKASIHLCVWMCLSALFSIFTILTIEEQKREYIFIDMVFYELHVLVIWFFLLKILIFSHASPYT